MLAWLRGFISAVGGWGVDKGAVWRPTMLPKPPTPATSAVSTAGSKAEKAKKKAEEAAAPRGPVRVRKEDLLKALMRKLTPYHAVVAPNGQVSERHRHQTPLAAS